MCEYRIRNRFRLGDGSKAFNGFAVAANQEFREIPFDAIAQHSRRGSRQRQLHIAARQSGLMSLQPLKRLALLAALDVIVVLRLAGMPAGAPRAALALVATLYHCLNHAFFKSLLFLGTGSVLHSTHERNLGKLGGLIRNMPWVAGLSLIGPGHAWTIDLAGITSGDSAGLAVLVLLELEKWVLRQRNAA